MDKVRNKNLTKRTMNCVMSCTCATEKCQGKGKAQLGVDVFATVKLETPFVTEDRTGEGGEMTRAYNEYRSVEAAKRLSEKSGYPALWKCTKNEQR